MRLSLPFRGNSSNDSYSKPGRVVKCEGKRQRVARWFKHSLQRGRQKQIANEEEVQVIPLRYYGPSVPHAGSSATEESLYRIRQEAFCHRLGSSGHSSVVGRIYPHKILELEHTDFDFEESESNDRPDEHTPPLIIPGRPTHGVSHQYPSATLSSDGCRVFALGEPGSSNTMLPSKERDSMPAMKTEEQTFRSANHTVNDYLDQAELAKQLAGPPYTPPNGGTAKTEGAPMQIGPVQTHEADHTYNKWNSLGKEDKVSQTTLQQRVVMRQRRQNLTVDRSLKEECCSITSWDGVSLSQISLT